MQKLYTLDNNFQLDWIEVDEKNPYAPVYAGHTGIGRFTDKRTEKQCYPVVDSLDGNTDFTFFKSWIWTPENPSGVWHKTPQSLANHLRKVADELFCGK